MEPSDFDDAKVTHRFRSPGRSNDDSLCSARSAETKPTNNQHYNQGCKVAQRVSTVSSLCVRRLVARREIERDEINVEAKYSIEER